MVLLASMPMNVTARKKSYAAHRRRMALNWWRTEIISREKDFREHWIQPAAAMRAGQTGRG